MNIFGFESELNLDNLKFTNFITSVNLFHVSDSIGSLKTSLITPNPHFVFG